MYKIIIIQPKLIPGERQYSCHNCLVFVFIIEKKYANVIMILLHYVYLTIVCLFV